MSQIRSVVIRSPPVKPLKRAFKTLAFATLLSTGIIASTPVFSQSPTKARIPDSAYVQREDAPQFMETIRGLYKWLENEKDSLPKYTYKFSINLKLDANPKGAISIRDGIVLTKKMQKQLLDSREILHICGTTANKEYFFIYRESESSGYLDVHLKVDSDR